MLIYIFDAKCQTWLITSLFVYVPESDNKTDPSEKEKNVLWVDLSD